MKDHADIIRGGRLQFFLENRPELTKKRDEPRVQNSWAVRLTLNRQWPVRISGNILLRKAKAKIHRKELLDAHITEKTNRIKRYRADGDMSSILKESEN